MAQLEICCFNAESAEVAVKAGADRVELCSDREAGGVTPPHEWLTQIKSRHPDTPIFVMVRPRGGNFLYTEEEFDIMKNTIATFKQHANGFVFGILNSDQTVDISRTTELVRLASPLPCTFHKAFDDTPSRFQAIEDVISTGCSSILTSGGAPEALQGTGALRILSEKAKGRIDIIAAGGIRFDNIGHICSLSKAQWYHSSALAEGSGLPEAAEIKGIIGIVNPKGAKTKGEGSRSLSMPSFKV